jgi:hypothetical protein
MGNVRRVLAIALIAVAAACQTSPQDAPPDQALPQDAPADVETLASQLCSLVDAYYRDTAANASQNQINADYQAMLNANWGLRAGLDATSGLSAEVKQAYGALDVSATQPVLYNASRDCRAFQRAWDAQNRPAPQSQVSARTYAEASTPKPTPEPTPKPAPKPTPKPTPQPTPIVTKVRVEAADQSPTRTGLSVAKGQLVRVRASGTWCMGGEPPSAECGTADGVRGANPEELPLILDSAPVGALIGRVGTGSWFLIGSTTNIRMPKAGKLALMFNDRPCCYLDNSGAVAVIVSVTPE